MNTHHPTTALFATAALACSVAAPVALGQEEDGDGAPHVAVAQLPDGSLEVEYEIGFGLDETADPPRITLDVSAYDAFAGGFRTFPVNDTPSPNDDLGFVSEIEGSGEEGGALNARIGLRLLSKDANFRAFLGAEEILTGPGDVLDLGFAFDTHPTWVLASGDPAFSGSSDASLELFNRGTGASLAAFDVRLDTEPIPEPAAAFALAGLGGLTLLRRRRPAAA